MYCERSGVFCLSLKNAKKKKLPFSRLVFYIGSLILGAGGGQVPQETAHELKSYKLLVTHSNILADAIR